MSEKMTHYDVVLFGSDLQGPELQVAIDKLAAMLHKCTPEQAKKLLESKGTVVAKDATAEFAHQIRDRLLTIGIRANLRPVVIGSKLELAPIEKKRVTKACPACAHEQTYTEGEQTAEVCGNCGTVFAKYERVSKEKEERERIRQELLAQHQVQLEAERHRKEAQEEADKRKRIEDEIRKQLGVSKIINSNSRLISFGVAVSLSGMVIGVVGSSIYDHLMNPGTPAVKVETKTIESDNSNAGVVAQMAIAKILGNSNNVAIAKSLIPGFELGAVDPWKQTNDESNAPTTGEAPATQPKSSVSSIKFLEETLSNLKTDTEWDQYLLAKVNTNLVKGNVDAAIRIIDKIKDPEQRFNRGARLIGQLWNRSQVSAAKTLSQHLITSGERLTGGPGARITALCTVGRNLYAAGHKTEADEILQQVRAIADTAIEPIDRSVANSEIAALLTIMGRTEDAQFLFSSAISSLEDISDPIKQLVTISRIIPSYAKAGYRSSALQLLEEAIRKCNSLPESSARSQALGQLAEISAQMVDMQTALIAMQSMSNNDIKEQTIYRIVAQEIVADRLAQAMDLAKYLKNPSYQALAFGFIGLSQQQQSSYRDMATVYNDRAATAVDSIGPVGEKVAVMSELGRFAARAGDTAKSGKYFATSKQLAGSITAISERDLALAIIAANKAQSLLFAEANKELSTITDADIRQPLSMSINNWQQEANIGL